MKLKLFRLFALLFLLLDIAPAVADEWPGDLRVMSWNIWHGGREDGDDVGPQRVVDVIKDSAADIVAMQETYGSGEIISEALGYHFLQRGTNLSIHSRHPIVEDISVFEEFNCVGGLIEVPGGRRIAFYNVWLPYAEDIWLPGVRAKQNTQQLQAACEPSAVALSAIYSGIQQRLSDKMYADVDVVVAGDFNSMSHNDYRAIALDQFQRRIDWKTSHVLVDAGFRDSYREANPQIRRADDSTWSPRFPTQEQDRIDFIYYKSKSLQAAKSRRLTNHAQKFPSDHAAVLTTFRSVSAPAGEKKLRTMSYNIKHGQGNDGKLNLARTAAVLKKQTPDIVALQEVDMNAKRSGKVNQAAWLGEQLNMHSAFGSFMDFQGGQYGLAVLTKFPIHSVTPLRLPDGNEPRVALIVEVILPDGRRIAIVDVHFDWVSDDGFRFQQANVLKTKLNSLDCPYILLGDFNDTPSSRTFQLLAEGAAEADKPAGQSLTFSSTNPSTEIDFIFTGPAAAWKIATSAFIDEPMASDHRPVFSELQLK